MPKKKTESRRGPTHEKAPDLIVLSREDAERYQPTLKEICISISDPNAEPANISDAFVAVLRLHFDDITEMGQASDILFAADHAGAISRFVDKWPDIDRVMVHCNMGVSRSPGIALGLCDTHGWATAALERSHPGWNRLVRALMREAATNNHRRKT